MKTLTYIAGIFCCLAMVAAQTFVSNGDRVLMLKGKVAGEYKNWLVIETFNGNEWKTNGYDPIYTRVLCDYKPMFRKLSNGQWEIMFQSEIAKDIP